MRDRFWKVGELAKETQLTVRTLHYYDEIGLLSPSIRTDSKHRVYSEADLAKLQQIMSLRQLGFSLEEINDCLKSKKFSPLKVVEMHLANLRSEMEGQKRLYDRLSALETALKSAERVSADDFLKTIEEMAMYEKYFTKEQLKELEERRKTLGDDYIKSVEAEWPQLIARVRSEMTKGTDPTSPEMQKLAKRWNELVNQFTGGNAEIRAAKERLYREEPEVRKQQGLDSEIIDYIKKASASLS
jgi:MerR family transcriptional regulator, thiopeptide resistance regulator